MENNNTAITLEDIETQIMLEYHVPIRLLDALCDYVVADYVIKSELYEHKDC